MTALVWFRRDLRVHDHPALRAALAAHREVVPAFCLDPRILDGRHASGARTRFLLESLRDLDDSLRKRGGGLVVRHGAPERELVGLAREVGASEVFCSFDVTPYARRRGHRVREAFDAAGIELHAHPGLGAVEDLRAVRTKDGRPFSVFTPFWRACLRAPHREVLAAPRRVEQPAHVESEPLPDLDALDLPEGVADPLPGGETAGRRRLMAFARGPVERYGAGQEALAEDATSRLSAYLHFGCISAREALERSPGEGEGSEAFRRQLYWADFYNHVIYHRPECARQELQERFRGTLAWNDDAEAFQAWCEGLTGFPLVDAGMRQLRREGWMHNRARLVVGSFLTKDLGVDWRWGESWFMRLLIDGDEAVNNGNWQWIASTGTDPAPYFRRAYNPTLQLRRHDLNGGYVRRYVPELDSVPDEHIAEPWKMPADVQQASGCVIGTRYPAPIVDHKQARAEALERYRAAAESHRAAAESHRTAAERHHEGSP